MGKLELVKVEEAEDGTLSKQEIDEQSLSMEEKHARRICRPCTYFAFKADGCRLGDKCAFCHFCGKAELKKQKKERKKKLREAAACLEDIDSKKKEQSSETVKPHSNI